MRDIILIGILCLSLFSIGCQDVGSYTDKNGNEFTLKMIELSKD